MDNWILDFEKRLQFVLESWIVEDVAHCWLSSSLAVLHEIHDFLRCSLWNKCERWKRNWLWSRNTSASVGFRTTFSTSIWTHTMSTLSINQWALVFTLAWHSMTGSITRKRSNKVVFISPRVDNRMFWGACQVTSLRELRICWGWFGFCDCAGRVWLTILTDKHPSQPYQPVSMGLGLVWLLPLPRQHWQWSRKILVLLGPRLGRSSVLVASSVHT